MLPTTIRPVTNDDVMREFRLYELFGQSREAQAMLTDILDRAIREGSGWEAFEAAKLFRKVGRLAEFESEVRSAWSADRADEFLSEVKRML